MSQFLIQQYLNDLSDLRKASGTTREGVVSEAFKDLLKGYAKSHDLIFLAQYELPKQDGKPRWVDGALVYDLRVPFGYWDNPAVTAEDVREMLIQHVLTEEIFSKEFDEDDFHRQNNVAKELYALTRGIQGSQ